MKAYMQRMGRSLMLPVAVLPAAAILMGIGYWIDPNVMTGLGDPNFLSVFLVKAGGAIIDNLPVLFAVGLALGMSKDKDGAAALSGLVAFLVVTTLLSTATVGAMKGIPVEQVDPSFAKIGNAFIGILSGLIAASMYNRFSQVKLPMALSFFSGKRLVPIMTALAMLVASGVLFFAWPIVFSGLVNFGEAISKLGAVGAGLYGFFNRLLIPTGLHHALNSVFWFDVAGINDIGNFLSGAGEKGITGMYQAGFFPMMMFGLPAGAYAIYRNARPEKKKATASLMIAAAFASFFTGITEPLEFSFMFVAWPLYVLHAILTGISLFISAFFHWTAGFAFSAGLVDFVLSLRNPIANQPYMLIVQGLVMAVLYFFVFDFAIKKFNLMTPGREEGDGEETPDIDTTGDNKFAVLASKIYQGLGGDANVTSIDNCTTRLRLTVSDTSKVDQAKIKATGVPGVKVIDDTNIQVIVGTEVQFVADEMTKIRNGATPVTSGEPAKKPEAKTITPKATSKETELFAVANGKVIPISEVQDDVFSAKMMGDGFAVIPTDGEVSTPVAGKITSIFPTKHALGIQTDSGIEVLLHMGLDTVELKGAPFTLHVEEGQVLKQGDKVATIDLAALETAGKKSDLIVVFTNQDIVEKYDLVKANQTVSANDSIGKVTVK
ncbi:PTS system, N-acetylglucosamine-specific IIBC component [Enterococcus haemoperoxidus ATCC BAA-382]|uniref:PTS system sucrose-specific EIIBCA component n=1 Tax=Enterococcus haemoperoxidus ATCC BAA-382 TaxID=1158608 RepID=R2STF2_9ENTE|nr:N-acetylglucosamine-specific PTS transporter subunit IIBC [Enterococcus haemoperoxidus]EOH98500.1 PTS system, N-acetylglucosamine-specific IIBC component [Enterococcus haemoperoxidus ATCC BAA-382]EOT62317.1 PTS system, N-acetylglucosamine-specific IIBC component [Enterococcus haemoperoxidus ATCC BAA-382]OJG55601.1 PTS system, N-acetylglucosamine-specific IIBC component [Enterococcus haemoperoxidus]